MADIYQMFDVLCSCGKSFWTVDGKCNECGKDRREEIRRDKDKVIIKKNNGIPRGKHWDAKKHRYVY